MSQDPLNAVLSPACDVVRSLWRSNAGWKRKNQRQQTGAARTARAQV